MGRIKKLPKTMLQQISDVAWLVHRGESKLGILNKDIQEKYTYITGKELVKFDTKKEVRGYFGNGRFEDLNRPIKSKKLNV